MNTVLTFVFRKWMYILLALVLVFSFVLIQTNNERIDELESEAADLENQINNLESEKANLESELADCESEKRELEVDGEFNKWYSEGDIENLENDKSYLESENDYLHRQVRSLQEELDYCRNR